MPTFIKPGFWNNKRKQLAGELDLDRLIESKITPGGTPTLQEVLNNNHDLVDGNNFQGTSAGIDNTGNNVNAFGDNAGLENAGNNVNALGNQTAYINQGSNINALGNGSAYVNSGNNVNAFGENAGTINTFNDVNLLGQNATADEDGQTVLSKDGTIMARISTSELTDTRKYNLPDADGTIALTSDLPQVANDFASDALAAAGGIAVGGLYHTAGVVKIRLV